MMNKITIAGKEIGPDYPPYIIAEAGINHNGELEKAFQMIRAAKLAGVDAIKFQTYKAEEMIGSDDLEYTYQSQGKSVTESMLAMFKRCEFTREEWAAIKQKCDEVSITFFSTPQNPSDLDMLLDLGVEVIKVGSDDFINFPLLETFAESRLPMIVSCGMSDLGEAHQALSAIGAFNGYPVALLLCTSQYPTPPNDVNLKKINTLRTAFPMVPIGFSDHTQGPLAAAIAVGFGACVFEKHFTLNNDLPGPDHWFSENPQTLKTWVDAIHTAHQMLGSSIVTPTPAEETIKTLARRSVTALRDIQPGETLDETNIGLRRPANGLPPTLFEEVLGHSAAHFIQQGQSLNWKDIQ